MEQPDFQKGGGILPVIVQDYSSGRVLMLAYMNEEAWNKTLETKKAHYWSRRRKKLWLKGETSGHIQEVMEILVDCDMDTILLKVIQKGEAACHEGYESCFFRRYENGKWKIVGKKIFDPQEVYGK